MGTPKYKISVYDIKQSIWIMKDVSSKEVEEKLGLKACNISNYLNTQELYFGRYCITGEKIIKPPVPPKPDFIDKHINPKDKDFLHRYNVIMRNLKKDYPKSVLSRIEITTREKMA